MNCAAIGNTETSHYQTGTTNTLHSLICTDWCKRTPC